MYFHMEARLKPTLLATSALFHSHSIKREARFPLASTLAESLVQDGIHGIEPYTLVDNSLLSVQREDRARLSLRYYKYKRMFDCIF